MSRRAVFGSFDWKSLRDELGEDVETLTGDFRHETLVGFRLKVNHKADIDLAATIQSTTLPTKAMRRQLLITSTELPLAALDTAQGRYQRMATFADRRGDVAGADAWRTVVETINVAKAAAAKAVAQQTWDVDE